MLESPNKVFIGIPNTGLLRTELVEWLMLQDDCDIFMPQAKPHDHCRNIIVNRFLETDYQWLLMVDSDIVPPNNVLGMIDNDVPVCAAYARTMSNGELIPVGMTKDDVGYHHDFKHSELGLHKVDAVGTGCILIKREVFERLDKPYFKFMYQDGLLINGEDFDFSERVGEIYFDSRYKCKHYTTIAI